MAPAEVNTAQADWPIVLANNFLEGIQSCGFECARMFIASGTTVEGPPPGCLCQLAVHVVPGFEPVKDPTQASVCAPIKVALVTLTLDLCVPVPADTAVLTPEQLTNAGTEQIQLLEDAMRGLQTAAAAGNLTGSIWSGKIGRDTWVAVSTEGGMARWQTRWTYRDT
jgi:hypothetical protein